MKYQSLSDQYRLIRSIALGFFSSLVLIPILTPKEGLTVAIMLSLGWDLFQMVKQGWLLDQRSTRLLFVEYSAKGSLVAEKTIALVFLSLGLLSFCVADLHNPSDVLPNSFHVFISFTAVFLTWVELHNGFALYYAKRYFDMNPLEVVNNEESKGFIFEGAEPTFSDFLYISYSIGLTYSMTDCGIKDSSVRRVVIIHCLASFLYSSTVLSIILSLATQVS